MIRYVVILLAVACFTALFAFTKIFEKIIRPTLDTSLLMVAVTNLVGALMFGAIGGFRVHVSPVSLFWTAMLALLLFCVIPKRREALRAALTCRPLAVMTLLGAAAYTGSFLHLKAAAFVPASIQFSLVSGGVIVLSALTAAVAFREKVTKQEWVSAMEAFLSTALFAF